MATAATADERLRQQSLTQRLISRPELGALIGAIAVFIIFSILAGGRGFLTQEGAATYLVVAAEIGILGAAVALLMIAGEFDLSIGSMVGAAGMVAALAMSVYGLPAWLAVVLAFAFALGIGALNGYLVVRTRLPSFIVTLGTLFILRGVTIGVTRLITGRTQVGGLGAFIETDPIAPLFTAEVGGLKVQILWWIVLTGVATFVLLRTSFGNWIYGVGGNEAAARNVGVPVTRVKIVLFMGTAAAGALLGLIQVFQSESADVLRGENKELEGIITAVVGGTLLTGGYVTALGTFLGALTLGMAKQGIFFTGISGDWYLATLGALLLGAVLFNNFVRRRASEAR